MSSTEKNGIENYDLDQLAAEQTYERLVEINRLLENRAKFYSGLTYDELNGIITSELERMYPYVNEHVLCGGNGIYPTLDENNIIVDSEWRRLDCASGRHNGFQLVKYEGDESENYLVMHRIILDDDIDEFGHRAESGQQDRYFFLEANTASIILTSDLNSVSIGNGLKSEEPKVLLDNFDLHSLKIQRLITSVAFRAITPETQNRQLEEAIGSAEAQSGLRGREIALRAGYGITPVFEGKMLELAGVDLRRMTVSGVCMGFESIQTFKARESSICKDIDRINRSSGLCLVVDLDDSTGLYVFENRHQIIYIPSRQINSLETA